MEPIKQQTVAEYYKEACKEPDYLFSLNPYELSIVYNYAQKRREEAFKLAFEIVTNAPQYKDVNIENWALKHSPDYKEAVKVINLINQIKAGKTTQPATPQAKKKNISLECKLTDKQITTLSMLATGQLFQANNEMAIIFQEFIQATDVTKLTGKIHIKNNRLLAYLFEHLYLRELIIKNYAAVIEKSKLFYSIDNNQLKASDLHKAKAEYNKFGRPKGSETIDKALKFAINIK